MFELEGEEEEEGSVPEGKLDELFDPLEVVGEDGSLEVVIGEEGSPPVVLGEDGSPPEVVGDEGFPPEVLGAPID